jgi:hypothetical protein
MTDPVFGVKIVQIDEGGRPIIGADLSTIGIIGPATGADPSVFPLNTPVRVYSNETSKIAKLGTRGYIPDALRAINDQLGEMQFAARCVVIRTAEGVDSDPAIKLQKTISNVVGNSLSATGIFAFLKSTVALAITPRLIIAPGYTSQLANSINVVTQLTDGAGYVDGTSYPITFSSGGVNAVQATGHAIGQSDGTLGDVIMDTPGAWYDTNATPTVTAPSAGKRVTVAALASGVGGGTGHEVGDIITLGNGVEIAVASVLSGGIINTITINDPGLIATSASNPTNPVAQVSTSGTGTGSSFTLTWAAYTAATYSATTAIGANPVCASLTSVLNQVLGHAVVESAGLSEEDDENWRETMNSKRLIPISGGCKVLDPDSSSVVFRPLAGRIVGIAVRRDYERARPSILGPTKRSKASSARCGTFRSRSPTLPTRLSLY